MFGCSDPRLNDLNDLGYNVVRLPREGIEPLDVLCLDGACRENLGAIDRIWSTPEPRPTVEGPIVASSIGGERTLGLDFSVGITILNGILTGMGAATPSLAWAFKTARKIQFQFEEVHLYAIDPLELGHYLQAGDFNLGNPVSSRCLDGHDVDLYVITEVLKSRSIGVIALDAAGRSLVLNTHVMTQAVGPSVDIGARPNGQMLFSYRGASALTFGFKVFQIRYEDGRWMALGRRRSPDEMSGPDDGRGVVFGRSLLGGDFKRR